MFEKEIRNSFNSDRIAVIDCEYKWSYTQFKIYVYNAKKHFESFNIKKVMIVLPQGFFAYSIIWGAYLAGITFCPVDVSTPAERIGFYTEKFGADLIIYCDSNIVNCSSAKKVKVQDFFYNMDFSVPSDFYVTCIAEDLAYVIFTSGSTGLPKGVKIKRKALNKLLQWTVSSWGIRSNDIFGQFSSLGFDLSIADIFTAIICGAALVPFASKGEKLLPGLMIKKYSITFWHSVPSVVDFLEKANHLNYENLHSLRVVSFCGERLFPKQLQLLFDANPNLIVFNTYGPTEITIFCTAIKLSGKNYRSFSDNTVAIGDPIEGWHVDLENISDGVGEIVVSGENIAEGYLDEKDSKGFSKVRTEGTSIERYHTGDFAQIKNNQMYFVGRKDSQIKHRGNRIDMSEIDYWLREYGCIAAITTYYCDKIISFVTIDDFCEERIYDFLLQKLPEYYIPHRIFCESIFPLSSSGKIDINALLRGVDYECDTKRNN